MSGLPVQPSKTKQKKITRYGAQPLSTKNKQRKTEERDKRRRNKANDNNLPEPLKLQQN